ncbi:MAG TPA: FtsQ-type POTRA domain-containing protein [Thermoanaerobaculia bacterium]|nr:FtsQ-type POTRA domain-containing protein [Thermoanaerobaculia bacterium]
MTQTGPALGAVAGGRVLDFRRRPALPRRRRRSFWLSLARPLSTALALVGLPVGLTAWVLTSPRFELRKLLVEGTQRIPAARVREALAPLLRENLVGLPLERVAALLHSQSWVESVEIEKELPDRLRVIVRERRPVVLLRAGGAAQGLAWGDAEGRSIAPVREGESTEGFLVVGLPHPVPGAAAKALGVAAELRRANPDWAALLSEVEVLDGDDFRLHTRALPFALLVRGGQVAPKAQRLAALLPELGRRYTGLEAVDLRFPRRIVVEPAAPPGPAHGPAGTAAQKPFFGG